MKLQLIRRIQHLETRHPHTARKISAIHFIVPWCRNRLPEDTVIPPGSRIVEDYEFPSVIRNFRGQKV